MRVSVEDHFVLMSMRNFRWETSTLPSAYPEQSAQNREQGLGSGRLVSPGRPGVVADLQELDAKLRELMSALHHVRHVLLNRPLQQPCRQTILVSTLRCLSAQTAVSHAVYAGTCVAAASHLRFAPQNVNASRKVCVLVVIDPARGKCSSSSEAFGKMHLANAKSKGILLPEVP